MNNSVRIKSLFALGTIGALLASCHNDGIESSIQPETKKNVGLDAVTCRFLQNTRSTDVDTWDMYDQIGISMCRQYTNDPSELYSELGSDEVAFNRCYYTTTSGSSEFTAYNATQKIWFPSDTTVVRFVAYYPYSEKIDKSDGLYHLRLSNQSERGHRLSDCDILWGAAEKLSKYEPDVNITFEHKLTQVVFYITPKGDLTKNDLQGSSLKLTHQRLEADFNIFSSNIKYMEEEGSLELKQSEEKIDGEYYLAAKAIVLPNDAEQNPVSFIDTDDKQLSELNNRHLVLSLPIGLRLTANLKDVDFKPGEKHVFYIEATTKGLTILRGEIAPWNTIEHDVVVIY